MTYGRQTIWTAERDAVLRRLWEEGLTVKAIGEAMGATKNSVVGRAHRLQLAGRPSPIGGAGQPRPPRPVRVPVAQILASAAKAAPPPQPAVIFVQPRPQACQWPTTSGPPWAFCGAPSVPSCPYCEPHLRKSRVQHRVAA